MLKLNKVILDDINELYEDLEYLETHRAPEINDENETLDDRQNAVFVMTSQYIEIAYTNYALENYSEVKPNLIKAAPFAFLRGFDKKLRTHSTDWSIQDDLNTCLLFGDAALLAQIKAMEWSLPEEEWMHPAIYQYDHLLMHIATGRMPTEQAITQAFTDAKSAKNKDVIQFFLPLIEAISALTTSNQALWQESIDKAIAWHTDECKFGDYKDMLDGFMCLNALTMAKLGKDLHGWHCTTDSLYLPLFLID
ncbi:Imm49 family immunity protein [Vibrio navarrensis]|uniref:Imm49 family immunity protein n=1 Tax=Vibrio navarrensis TaxID=29495 RepID=UPI001302221F|nr:Imm49 family immunity protein [Vibrio navarrensis]